MHASNFSTLRICNSACIGPTALKFGSCTFLSLHLQERKFQPNSLLINEVMPLQSWKIGCMYKTLFANPVTNVYGCMYAYVCVYVCICVCMYVCVQVCTYVCICACIDVQKLRIKLIIFLIILGYIRQKCVSKVANLLATHTFYLLLCHNHSYFYRSKSDCDSYVVVVGLYITSYTTADMKGLISSTNVIGCPHI